MPRKNNSVPRASRASPGRFKIKHETIANLEADLLRRIRACEGQSRIELARGLNLAPSTVGIYVDHLIEEGFLSEGKRIGREFGRPPTALGLNAQAGRFIGVDFEARNIMATSVDFSQKPIKQFHDTIAASDSVEQILAKIENAICKVMADDGRRVLAIGLGVPGAIDPVNGVARHYKHIQGWSNIPLVNRITARFNVPVFLENNTRSMALAELWFGQGRGLQNFICLAVRSGIGAGIIVDGRIYHGSNHLAGEIGDWPCALTGVANGSSSGRFPTLEEIASLRGIHASLKNGSGGALSAFTSNELDLAGMLQAARGENRAVLELLDRVSRTLGLVLSQLNRAFNPGRIIMAGPFTLFGDLFLARLQENFRQFSPSSDLPPVVNSNLGEFNGALGAAALAVHEWKPVQNQVKRLRAKV